MNIRLAVRQILEETKMAAILDSSIADITQIIKNAATDAFGYNVLDVVLEESAEADIVYTVSLQHTRPDFGKYIELMKNKPMSKNYKIYFDTPSSKTQLTRWLTGYKQGADIDARQKARP